MKSLPQHAIVLQHPRSPVVFDPRDPPVHDVEPSSPDSVIRAQADTIAALQKVVRDLTKTPLVIQALKGEIAPDTCCACGCHIPLRPLQTSWPLWVLYGDPHLAVTRAMAYALEYE